MKKISFNEIKKIAKQFFKNASPSHDWFHTERVFNLTKKICNEEHADFKVVGTAALLHDIARKDEDEGLIDF